MPKDTGTARFVWEDPLLLSEQLSEEERMVRDARMFAIGGGTVEMMRNLIADRILPNRAEFRRNERA